MVCSKNVAANLTKEIRTDIQETIREQREMLVNLTSRDIERECRA